MHLLQRAWPRRLTREESCSDLDPLKPRNLVGRIQPNPTRKPTLNCFWTKNAALFDDDLEGVEKADGRFIGVEISNSPATLSDVVDLNETFTAPCLVGGVPQLHIDNNVIDDSDSGFGLGLGLGAAISLWRCEVPVDDINAEEDHQLSQKFRPAITPPVISRAASRKTSIPSRRPILGHFGSDSNAESGSKFCEEIQDAEEAGGGASYPAGALAAGCNSDHPTVSQFPRTRLHTHDNFEEGSNQPSLPFQLPLPSFTQVEDYHRRARGLLPEPVPFTFVRTSSEEMACRGPVIFVSETFSESASESDGDGCWQVAPLKIFQPPIVLDTPGLHVGRLGVGSWGDEEEPSDVEGNSEGGVNFPSRVPRLGTGDVNRSTQWRSGKGSVHLRTSSPEPTPSLVSTEERTMPSLTSVLLASGLVPDSLAREPQGGLPPRIVQRNHQPRPTGTHTSAGAPNTQERTFSKESQLLPCTRTETESSGCETIATGHGSGFSEEGTVLTSIASATTTVDPMPFAYKPQHDEETLSRLRRREKVRGKVKRALYAFALGFGGPGSAPLVTVGAA